MISVRDRQQICLFSFFFVFGILFVWQVKYSFEENRIFYGKFGEFFPVFC